MPDLTRRATLIVQFQNEISSGAKAAASALGGVDDNAKKAALSANELKLATLKLADAQKKLASETDPIKQAKLAVEIDNLTRKIEDNSKSMQGHTAKTQAQKGAVEQLSNSVKSYAANLVTSVVSIGAFAAAIGYSVKQAIEAEAIMAKTEAVIKSTGGVAGMTANQVSDLATTLSNLSGVDDDLIQSAENVMLTFTAVGKDTFPEAMKAALNMSLALGTDLQGSVIQVGKALQDPIAGLTALRKVGVNFNASARETIKNFMAIGDTASAQKFILAELNTEFGGMAEAVGDTLQGKLNKARVAIDNVSESVGKGLIPLIGKFAETVTPAVDRFGIAMSHAVSQMDGAVSPLEELNYQLEQQTYYFGENSKEAIAARDALSKYQAMLDSIKMTNVESTLRTNMRTLYETADAMDTLGEAIPDYGQFDGAAKGMLALAEATRQSGDAAKVWADFLQKEVAGKLSALKIAMAGAVANENKQYADSQQDLRQKAAELKAELDKLQATQGRAVTVNKAGAMSDNERAATQDKLAAVTEDLTNRTRKKNETDAEFASRMSDLQVKADGLTEKLGNSTGAVKSYIDNSKKIGELTKEYDAINAEIDANAAKHEEATKRILYGYLEQELARQNSLKGISGYTDQQVAFLNRTAQEMGLKSASDVRAYQTIAEAAKLAATDQAAALEMVNQAFLDAQNPVKQYYDALNLLPRDIRIKISTDLSGFKMPDMPSAGAPTGGKPTATTPTTKTTKPKTTTTTPTRSNRGGTQMQAGGDFIVPSGFPDDSYRVNVSSGERVVVIPQNKVGETSQLKEMLAQRRLEKMMAGYKFPFGTAGAVPPTPPANPAQAITVHAPITIHAAPGQSAQEIAQAVSVQLARRLRGSRANSGATAGG